MQYQFKENDIVEWDRPDKKGIATSVVVAIFEKTETKNTHLTETSYLLEGGDLEFGMTVPVSSKSLRLHTPKMIYLLVAHVGSGMDSWTENVYADIESEKLTALSERLNQLADRYHAEKNTISSLLVKWEKEVCNRPQHQDFRYPIRPNGTRKEFEKTAEYAKWKNEQDEYLKIQAAWNDKWATEKLRLEKEIHIWSADERPYVEMLVRFYDKPRFEIEEIPLPPGT